MPVSSSSASHTYASIVCIIRKIIRELMLSPCLLDPIGHGVNLTFVYVHMLPIHVLQNQSHGHTSLQYPLWYVLISWGVNILVTFQEEENSLSISSPGIKKSQQKTQTHLSNLCYIKRKRLRETSHLKPDPKRRTLIVTQKIIGVSKCHKFKVNMHKFFLVCNNLQ